MAPRGRPRTLVFPNEGESVALEGGMSADVSLDAETPSEPHNPYANYATPDPEKDPKGYADYVAQLRGKRKPYGAQMQKLAYPARSGYKRHWFNDVGGRVQEYQDAGWSLVIDQKGKPVQRTVGAARDNTPLKAHLLEIPSIFWEEVEAERHSLAKAKMDDIKSAPIRSKPGEAKASDQGKFYSPKEEAVTISESLSRR